MKLLAISVILIAIACIMLVCTDILITRRIDKLEKQVMQLSDSLFVFRPLTDKPLFFARGEGCDLMGGTLESGIPLVKYKFYCKKDEEKK